MNIVDLHHCPVCTRKYKTLAKWNKHIDEVHPFAVTDQNERVFTVDEKHYLLEKMQYYFTLLSRDNIGPDDPEFIAVSHKLNLSKDARHWDFRMRVIESTLLSKATSDPKQLLVLIDEFQAFLNLGKPLRGGNFCPSMVIDLVWHASMLDELRYSAMCARFFTKTKSLSHCLEENDGDHKRRSDQFQECFRRRFNRHPILISDLITGVSSDGGNAHEIAKQMLNDEKMAQAEAFRRQQAMVQDYIDLARRVADRDLDDGKC
jgi:hypothetical protein